jgi:hypothetical protein
MLYQETDKIQYEYQSDDTAADDGDYDVDDDGN